MSCCFLEETLPAAVLISDQPRRQPSDEWRFPWLGRVIKFTKNKLSYARLEEDHVDEDDIELAQIHSSTNDAFTKRDSIREDSVSIADVDETFKSMASSDDDVDDKSCVGGDSNMHTQSKPSVYFTRKVVLSCIMYGLLAFIFLANDELFPVGPFHIFFRLY